VWHPSSVSGACSAKSRRWDFRWRPRMLSARRYAARYVKKSCNTALCAEGGRFRRDCGAMAQRDGAPAAFLEALLLAETEGSWLVRIVGG
jgi:hypothetical protein